MLSAVATAALSLVKCDKVCNGWEEAAAWIWMTCLSVALCGIPIAMISRFKPNAHGFARKFVEVSGILAMAGLIPLAHVFAPWMYIYSIVWFLMCWIAIVCALKIQVCHEVWSGLCRHLRCLRCACFG